MKPGASDFPRLGMLSCAISNFDQKGRSHGIAQLTKKQKQKQLDIDAVTRRILIWRNEDNSTEWQESEEVRARHHRPSDDPELFHSQT
jgi:heme-degrading monooxygenase HmoA